METIQWHNIWKEIAEISNSGSKNINKRWEIGSILGNTSVELSDGLVRSTTDTGNITEYSIAAIQPMILHKLRPDATEQIEFSLPFDLSIGVARARVTVGDKQVQVIIDTGADHSVFFIESEASGSWHEC